MSHLCAPVRRFSTIVAFLCGLVTGFNQPAHSDPTSEASDAIRMTFESALFTLPPKTQEHFCARMYRLTGDERFVNPVLFYTLITERSLAADIERYADPAYRSERAGRMMAQFRGSNRKDQLRHALFADRSEILFDLSMLSACNRLATYGEGVESLRPILDEALTILGTVDFASFLLDPEVIRVYSAQTANYVYYLYDLGLTDIRNEYRAAFAVAFPDREDLDISNLEYKDKIYGLTHIIIAASGYYQHEVDPSEFKWLLGYFESNLDRILQETKPDVIAEVGISFLLAGDRESSAVERCRKAILKAIDEDAGMILSVSGDDDLEDGEHRNILAWMLLNWPNQLYPGPRLIEFSHCARVLDR